VHLNGHASRKKTLPKQATTRAQAVTLPTKPPPEPPPEPPLEQVFRDVTFQPSKAGDGPGNHAASATGKNPRNRKNKLVRELSGEKQAEAQAQRARETERIAELGRFRNSNDILPCVAQDDARPLVATRDLYDSAHGRMLGGEGLHAMLRPNARREGGPLVRTPGALPRRYPVEHLNSAGVAIDSVFDDTFERQQRLDGIAGIGIGDARKTVAAARSAALFGALGRRATRRDFDAALHQRTAYTKR